MSEHIVTCPNLAMGQSCTPCEELVPLNQEIAKAESLLAALNANRIAIYGRMNRAHDPITSNLPSEIVSNIFANFLPPNISWQYGPCIHRSARAPHDICTTPLLLGAVCTAWRAIAWYTPLLWTSISVNLNRFNEAHIETLNEWLRRSGELPLYIGISGNDSSISTVSKKAMDSLALYSHRWFYLGLLSPQFFLHYLNPTLSQAFMLNSLSMCIKATSLVEGLDLGNIPNLRSLHMDHLQLDKILNIDWKKLASVHVSVPSIDMCYDLFSKASFLRHCTFDLYPSRNNVLTTWDTVLVHTHLVFLDIRKWTRLTDFFLSSMEFPALQHLVIDSRTTRTNLENITSLLQRSRCLLRTLEIDLSFKEMDFEQKIIPLLAEIPSLEFLEIRRVAACRSITSSDSVDPLLTWLSTTALTEETSTSQSTFLPNLQVLVIKNMELSSDRILEMVKAHFDDSTGLEAPTSEEDETRQYIRPLFYLDIQVWGRKYEHMESDLTRQLQYAIEGGLEVTISVGWDDNDIADILNETLYLS